MVGAGVAESAFGRPFVSTAGGPTRTWPLDVPEFHGSDPHVREQLTLGVLIWALALAAACTTQYDVPPLERRAYKLNEAIMCPVCPGESIDQSQNPLAVQMRAIVLDQLQEGRTEGEIKAFFVERYGESVLLEPPASGFNLAVWVLPPLAVGVAAMALFGALRLMRRPRAPETDPALDSVRLSAEEQDEYFRRIEAALDFDGPVAERARLDTQSDEA